MSKVETSAPAVITARVIGEYVKTHMKGSQDDSLTREERDLHTGKVIGAIAAVMNGSAWGYAVKQAAKRSYIAVSFKHEIKSKDGESLAVKADGNLIFAFYGVGKDKVIAQAKAMFNNVKLKSDVVVPVEDEVMAAASMIDCGAV